MEPTESQLQEMVEREERGEAIGDDFFDDIPEISAGPQPPSKSKFDEEHLRTEDELKERGSNKNPDVAEIKEENEDRVQNDDASM
jgi:hypothetical protein